MNAGARLESAIMRAARWYQRAGVAELAKQHTPRAFDGTFTADAAIDFKGWRRMLLDREPYGADRYREPLYVECKSTAALAIKFGDNGIRLPQLRAMRDAVTRGISMLLVVDFAYVGEVYAVSAEHVIDFAGKPWRASLSLDWFRARGQVLKQQNRDTPRWCVWFLDGRTHPQFAEAAVVVLHEQNTADGVVELYPAPSLNTGKRAESFRELLARKPGRDASDAEIIAWRRDFSAFELDRNIREAKRQQARTPKGRKRGDWMNRK